MIIKKATSNYITIDSDIKDAKFLCQCIELGLNTFPMKAEDHTRLRNFLLYLQELANKT